MIELNQNGEPRKGNFFQNRLPTVTGSSTDPAGAGGVGLGGQYVGGGTNQIKALLSPSADFSGFGLRVASWAFTQEALSPAPSPRQALGPACGSVT